MEVIGLGSGLGMRQGEIKCRFIFEAFFKIVITINLRFFRDMEMET